MKIFAFATIFTATLAAPFYSVDPAIDCIDIATTTITTESADSLPDAAHALDEADDEIFDYSNEKFEEIFGEIEIIVKQNE